VLLSSLKSDGIGSHCGVFDLLILATGFADGQPVNRPLVLDAASLRLAGKDFTGRMTGSLGTSDPRRINLRVNQPDPKC
jgi:hypothetical protein